MVTTAALFWPKAILVEAVQPVIILGIVFCTGLVPVDKYPDWVQPVVRNQPMSLLSMRCGGCRWAARCCSR